MTESPMTINPNLAERVADDAIRFERVLRAPIERVWDALTTERGLQTWIGPARVDLRAGGAFTVQLTEDNEMQGRVLELDPPHRLAVFWQEVEDGAVLPHGAAPDHHSELIFTLAEVPEGTRLTLTHRLIANVERMRSFGAGWHAFLERLDAAVRGAQADDVGVIFLRTKPLYVARFD